MLKVLNALKKVCDRVCSRAGNSAGKRIGCLVRIARLCLDTPSDTTWAVPAAVSADGTPRSALLKFRCGADSVYVYTSGYASFAGERVPHGPVSVTGILLPGKVGGRRVYELKMRDLNDVQVD